MAEGDPRLLLLPLSPPDIDPSCPTQIWLKDKFLAFLTFQIWQRVNCNSTHYHRLIIDFPPDWTWTTSQERPCQLKLNLQMCMDVSPSSGMALLLLLFKFDQTAHDVLRTKNRAGYNCRIQIQRLGAKVWTADGWMCLRSPALPRVNCLPHTLTHTYTRTL